MIKNLHKFVSVIAILTFTFVSVSTEAQDDDSIPVHDLGQRVQGQQYPIKLTAKNIDCDAAQDFEFELENMPWLVTPGAPVVNGLGTGQSKSIPTQLDFQYTPVGTYFGHITSKCTSCGWFIFAACVEQGQDLIMKVNVVEPGLTPRQQKKALKVSGKVKNPFAKLKPYQPAQTALNASISTEDEKLLEFEDRDRLLRARGNVKAAEARGTKARNEARTARLNKNKCERELAQLKAAMDAANRKAAIAKQDAANAKGAAEAAKKELAKLQDDKDAAQKAVDIADANARAAMDYLVQVVAKDGENGRRYERARAQIDKLQAKWKAAKDAQDEINNSDKLRQDAADQAKKDAAAAKAASAKADGAAAAAKAAYDKKARECLGLGAAKDAADKKLVDAENNAKHAVGIANYEEAEAAKLAGKARIKAVKRGIKKLENDLEKKKNACVRLEKEWKEKMRQMTGAFNALIQNGHFKAKENAAKNPPTPSSLFDQYLELGYNVVVDTAGTVGGAPGFSSGSLMLGALQAGYGIADIRKSELTPGTNAHGRSDGQELRDWLVKNSFANSSKGDKDARSVEHEMRRIMDDRNIMEKELKRGIAAMERCKKEVARIKAKLAAAKAAQK